MPRPTMADAYKLFHSGAAALAQVEENGVAIDVELLERTIAETEERAKVLEGELQQTDVWKIWRKEFGGESNLGSNPQLARVLYDKMGLHCKERTASGKQSVSEKALQDIDHPFVKKLFDVRDLRKTSGTFLKGLRREVVDGLLHAHFHLHTTVSGRGSSSDPNFQNFPNRDPRMAELVRSCIIPRSKKRIIGELDFKGIEVCIAAAVTGDRSLRRYVSDKKSDMHRDMAMQIFRLEKGQVSKPIRQAVKGMFVFAEFYGDYYVHCAKYLWESVDRDNLKLADGTPLRKHLRRKGLKEMGLCDPDSREAPLRGSFEEHVKNIEQDFWGNRFREYRDWKNKVWDDFRREGEAFLETGFRIVWSKSGLLGKKELANYKIQGAAFHCLLWTLIRLQKWLNKNRMESVIVGQIHDSIVMDLVESEVQDVLTEAHRIVVEDLPRHWEWICVPLEIEIELAPRGKSWFAKKPWICDDGTWGPKPSDN